MSKYIFNARDIAAYFKWFSVPQYLEVSYMQHIYSIGKPVLAAPLTKDFEKFKGEVYRELYYLWANGFEDEKSDISYMVEEGARALICEQECINLESYMKLITLHLIFTKNLPYVKLNFTGLPLSLGIRCDFEQFERNVVMAINGLSLYCQDAFGKPFDLSLGVPDELLSISLDESFKKSILKGQDFREKLRSEQKARMKELKEKSIEIFGSIPMQKKTKAKKAAKKPATKKSHGEVANRRTTSKSQPKGTPLQETRHTNKDE